MVAWILDAATRVFEEHGYAAGTTNRIADKAGVSVGSLYQYFPNKESLLTALALDHLRKGETVAEAALREARTKLPPLGEMLTGFIEAFIALHERNPVLHRLLFEEAPLPQEVWRAYRSFTDRLVSDVTDLLTAHPEVNTLNVHAAAYLLVTSFEALAHQLVIRPPEGLETGEVSGELVALFRGYLQRGANDASQKV